jgi:hypothetical protein
LGRQKCARSQRRPHKKADEGERRRTNSLFGFEFEFPWSFGIGHFIVLAAKNLFSAKRYYAVQSGTKRN